MFRKSASLLIAAIAVAALPSTASAFCESCYIPPPQPCTTCYQMQTVPPQYRTVQETVMVAPGGTIAHLLRAGGPALRDLRLLSVWDFWNTGRRRDFPAAAFSRQNGCTESEPTTTAAISASEL